MRFGHYSSPLLMTGQQVTAGRDATTTAAHEGPSTPGRGAVYAEVSLIP